MSDLPVYAFKTVKRWITYWLNFKGKRVQIYLRHGINLSHQSGNPLRILGFNIDDKTTVEMNILDNLIGTVADIVESPFGILLKNVCIAGEKTTIIDMTFIPMSEITKMNIFKKEAGQVNYDFPQSAKPKESNNGK
jgi:hypothetical protein